MPILRGFYELARPWARVDLTVRDLKQLLIYILFEWRNYMQHETISENDLTIIPTGEGFEFWLTQKYISTELKKTLEKSDILIIPQIGFRESPDPVFPVKTEELFNFMKNKSDIIDICIDDEDYKEIALHSDLLIIATFLVSSVVLPVLVNILSDYIKNKLFSDKSDRAIKVSIIVQNKQGTSKKITYEGKPENFDNTIKSIENLLED